MHIISQQLRNHVWDVVKYDPEKLHFLLRDFSCWNEKMPGMGGASQCSKRDKAISNSPSAFLLVSSKS